MGGESSSKTQFPGRGPVSSAKQVHVVRLLNDLVRRHGALLSRISRAEELADVIACDLEQLQSHFAVDALISDGDGSSPAGRCNLRALETLRQIAEAGTSSLELNHRADGSAEVRIAAGKQFTLPPTLAHLLSILSDDSGRSDEGLVGWKTLDEVAILLQKREGRPFTRHGVTQQVYRLRKELFQRGGVNPFLVQTNRRLGVRFAVRRKQTPVIEIDPR